VAAFQTIWDMLGFLPGDNVSYIADQLQAVGLYINFAQNIPINEYDDKVKIKFTGPTGKQTNNMDISNRDLAAIYRMLGGTGEKPPLSKLFNGNKLRASYQAIRTASQYRQDPRGLRGNPPKEILSQKKELVRIASEVALNIINHFGPSYEGGYVGVANSTLLPVSIRRVIDTMSQPFDAPNAKKFSMYYPKYYEVPEWQKGGNMANHIWFGQTDKGHDEVIRKGIAIAKTGNVFKNRRRGLRRNQMRSSFDKPVFGPGRAEYKRIDTTTSAGMRLEQKMRRAGWYQAQVTPFSTVLYRKKRR
jgi:hypothetical protein